MGIFDKLLRRKEKPLETEELEEEQTLITLDARNMGEWADKLIAHFELKKQYKDFLEQTEKTKRKIYESLRQFTDETVISAIPERARTVTTLHGSEFAEQTKKLVDKASFTGLFSFDEEHAEFLEAIGEFRSRTKKNASALEEFMGKELKTTNKGIAELEDRIIKFMESLENVKFHYIKQIHDAYTRLKNLELQSEKYQQLKESLEDDLQRTRDKRQKIEEEIKKQRSLIRNEQSQEALGKLQTLEEEFDKTINQYELVAKDALRYYQRYSDELELEPSIKKKLEGITSDASGWLEKNSEDVTHVLRHCADQVDSEGRGNVSNLVKRLVDLANSADLNGKNANNILPKQRELKKEIIQDVAALSIYDQQQFLIRANREEASIQAKLNFLEEELSPRKRLVIEREVKDAAINLGVKITGQKEEDLEKEPQEPAQEETIEKEEDTPLVSEIEDFPDEEESSETPSQEEPEPQIESKDESEPPESGEDIDEDIKEAEEELKRNPPDLK